LGISGGSERLSDGDGGGSDRAGVDRIGRNMAGRHKARGDDSRTNWIINERIARIEEGVRNRIGRERIDMDRIGKEGIGLHWGSDGAGIEEQGCRRCKKKRK
jgi:hypothetical protein